MDEKEGKKRKTVSFRTTDGANVSFIFSSMSSPLAIPNNTDQRGGSATTANSAAATVQKLLFRSGNSAIAATVQ